MPGQTKWWPQSPSETAVVLVRMRDSLTLHKRDLIRGFAGMTGSLLVALLLGSWENGSNAAGWGVLLALVVMAVIIRSDRLHEMILRIPLTDNHLNKFERQIDEYKAMGLWPPTC